MQFTHRQGHSIARFISAVLLAEAEVERARRGATATQALEAGLAARASTCRIDSAQLLVPTAAFSAVAAAAADTMAALETGSNGGIGGGGNVGSNGQAHTGGGAGGSNAANPGASDGGSGVVLIRVPRQSS